MRVGTKLYGFCRGLFGRDFPHQGRVEAIGYDWIVVRAKGVLYFASTPGDDIVEQFKEEDLINPDPDPIGRLVG